MARLVEAPDLKSIDTNEYQNNDTPFMYYGNLIIPSWSRDSKPNKYLQCLQKYVASDLDAYEVLDNQTGEILYSVPKDASFADDLLKDIKALMNGEMWTSYEFNNSRIEESLYRVLGVQLDESYYDPFSAEFITDYNTYSTHYGDNIYISKYGDADGNIAYYAFEPDGDQIRFLDREEMIKKLGLKSDFAGSEINK